ncbi:hypothetical protein BDP27DRAFT_1319382, partial [Rhodocollybia butyracea]
MRYYNESRIMGTSQVLMGYWDEHNYLRRTELVHIDRIPLIIKGMKHLHSKEWDTKEWDKNLGFQRAHSWIGAIRERLLKMREDRSRAGIAHLDHSDLRDNVVWRLLFERRGEVYQLRVREIPSISLQKPMRNTYIGLVNQGLIKTLHTTLL